MESKEKKLRCCKSQSELIMEDAEDLQVLKQHTLKQETQLVSIKHQISEIRSDWLKLKQMIKDI